MLYVIRSVIHANHLDVHLDGSHSTPWTLDISKNVGSCPRLMHALVVNPQGQCGQWSCLMGNLIESPSNKRKSHLTRKATLKKDLSENNISWLILAAKLLKRSRMWERNRAVEESSIIYSKPPSRCVGMALSQTISLPTLWSFPFPAIGAVSAPCKAKEVKEISALASRCRRPCERWEAWRRGWFFFLIWKKCGRVKSHEFTCEIMWIGGPNHPSIACDFDRYSMIIYWQSGLDSSQM